MTATVSGPRVEPTRLIGFILAVLTVFGPISLDLYLPVLPALSADLGSSVSGAQLTMTACLLGLAFGQVFAGPLSDRYGRRPILIVGVIAFVGTSFLCAMSTSITQLVILRLVQGLAGAVGLVIAQAGGRDVYEGTRLTRHYSRIVVLSGLAAIVAPVVGGQLAEVISWRGFFLVLAGIGVVLLALVLSGYRETLPAAHRVTGGLSVTASHLRVLIRDRLFVVATVASSLTSAAYFAYLAGAAYVLQDIYELSPGAFSLVFGLNAAGFALFGFLSGRLSETWSERRVFAFGLVIITAGATGLLVIALAELPLAATVVAFLAIAAGAAVVAPPSTSLALRHYSEFAGTASSILGVARFTAGAIAAPLVGVAGSLTMVPLAVVALASCLAACACFVFVPRHVAA